MKKQLSSIIALAAPTVLASSCMSRVGSDYPSHSGSTHSRSRHRDQLIQSVNHQPTVWEHSYTNAFLWRRIMDDPAVFHPRALPQDFPITRETGDWVVDPQDDAAFFVPKSPCGGYPPSVWKAEAIKAVNQYDSDKQASINSKTVLFGWPASFVARLLSGMGGPH